MPWRLRRHEQTLHACSMPSCVVAVAQPLCRRPVLDRQIRWQASQHDTNKTTRLFGVGGTPPAVFAPPRGIGSPWCHHTHAHRPSYAIVLPNDTTTHTHSPQQARSSSASTQLSSNSQAWPLLRLLAHQDGGRLATPKHPQSLPRTHARTRHSRTPTRTHTCTPTGANAQFLVGGGSP